MERRGVQPFMLTVAVDRFFLSFLALLPFLPFGSRSNNFALELL